MVATIASSLADLFGHPSVRGNIYLQDLKAWPDIMIIAVRILDSQLRCNKWKLWPNPKPLTPRL